MSIDEMKEAIIRRYGFEHPNTIGFFNACEGMDEMRINVLKLVFDYLYNHSLQIEEE